MRRRIGVITVARSDYGLYAPILSTLRADARCDVRLYVTGAHCSPLFGETVREIERGSVPIAARVPGITAGDTSAAIVESMGEITKGFARVFAEDRPDIVVVLGDRFDMFAAASAAIPFRIPLAHIHGGEVTYGAMDEYFRHALTKMSAVHFATTEVYARRIVQMGEDPSRVFAVGASGIDVALHAPLLSRAVLTERFGIDWTRPVLLVTMHPVTMDSAHAQEHVDALCEALERQSDCAVVWTYPNTDPGHTIIIRAMEVFASRHPSTTRVVKHFGHEAHLSMMRYAAAMVGNSSSGVIEAASFKLPVVNVGTRQEGRVRGANVIDVPCTAAVIDDGIRRARSAAFKASLAQCVNPYGDGSASERIADILCTIALPTGTAKRFVDIPYEQSL